MVGSAPSHPGGLEHETELVAHPGLAHDFAEAPGTKGGLDRALVAVGLGPPRASRNPSSNEPAIMNRTAAIANGGIVSTQIRIAR